MSMHLCMFVCRCDMFVYICVCFYMFMRGVHIFSLLYIFVCTHI